MFKKDELPKAAVPAAKDNKESALGFKQGPPAVVGSSLVVDGTIRGQEDLLVDGRVEGDIALPNNIVTVGPEGQVKARIHAAVVVVEGRVEGDLVGEEQIEIRRSGNVLGNIVAPRVGLEDGAQFKGNIDMSPKRQNTAATPAPMSKQSREKNAQSVGENSNPKLSG